jgi:predicted DNA-binding transcriptional regulator AlpA
MAASIESLAMTTSTLDDIEVAKLIKMSLPWVRKDRATKRILPFFRIGRSIRYDAATVLKAVQSRTEGGLK